jgi:hypothetical protein
MANEIAAPATPTLPEELNSHIQRLQTDLDTIQRELDQALDVWRETLSTEKQEFEAQIKAKDSAWAERDQRWLDQRQEYETRIETLEATFKAQLNATEQNALRALNDLDTAWQSERAAWGQEAGQKIRELEARLDDKNAERAKQDEIIHALRAQIEHWENTQAQSAAKERELLRERQALTDRVQFLEQALEEQSRQESPRAELELQLREAWETHFEHQAGLWRAERDDFQNQIRSLESALQGEAKRTDAAVQSALRASEESLQSRFEQEHAAESERIQAAIREATEKAQADAAAQADAERQASAQERRALEEKLSALDAQLARANDRQRETEVRLQNNQAGWERRLADDQAIWSRERVTMQSRLSAVENDLKAREAQAQRDVQEAVQAANRSWETRLSDERAAWAREKTELQERLASLETEWRTRQQREDQTTKEAVESVKRAWEKDKSTWQQSLWQTLQEATEREAAWAKERQDHEKFVAHIESELAAVREKLLSEDQQRALSQQFMAHYMTALENEISMLGEIVTQFKPSLSRFRRKSDLVAIGNDPNRAFR